MDIDIYEMFQLLTELEQNTVLLKRSNTPPDYTEWVREADGSYINWPKRSMIDDLQRINMLITEPMALTSGEEAVRYRLSEKALRILRARESKNPTHKTPYLGEKCWLALHRRWDGVEVYPYLGVAPPDLSQLLPPDWQAQDFGESFTIRSFSLHEHLRDKDLIHESSEEA